MPACTNYHAGAVGDLMRCGDTLTVEVEGSHGNAYQAGGRGDVFRHFVGTLHTQHARSNGLVPLLRKS